MNKKILSMITILMMLLSSFSFAEVTESVSTQDFTTNQFENNILEEPNVMELEAYTYFGVLSVTTFAMADEISITKATEEKETFKQQTLEQITEYLESDLQTEGKKIELSDTFTDLYDIDGLITGYMIPLINNKKEIGYVFVSVFDGKCTVQEIFIEDNASVKFKDKISKAKEKAHHDSDISKVIFIPPMNYIIEINEKDGGVDYLTLDGDSIGQDVKDNKEKIREFIKELKNTMLKHNVPAQNMSALTAVAVEDVRLTREAQDKFVPITSVPGTSATAYGGSQLWWPKDSDQRNRGCGPVSAANVTQYLASKK